MFSGTFRSRFRHLLWYQYLLLARFLRMEIKLLASLLGDACLYFQIVFIITFGFPSPSSPWRHHVCVVFVLKEECETLCVKFFKVSLTFTLSGQTHTERKRTLVGSECNACRPNVRSMLTRALALMVLDAQLVASFGVAKYWENHRCQLHHTHIVVNINLSFWGTSENLYKMPYTKVNSVCCKTYGEIFFVDKYPNPRHWFVYLTFIS